MIKIGLHGHFYDSMLLHRATAVCTYKSWGEYTHLSFAFSKHFTEMESDRMHQSTSCFFHGGISFWEKFWSPYISRPTLFLIIAYYFMYHYGCTITYLISFLVMGTQFTSIFPHRQMLRWMHLTDTIRSPM